MPEEFRDTVETYDVETELGRDDLTIVYSAHRRSDGLPVIVRVVAPQFVFDTFFVRRFKDAMTRSMHLDHPNIVKIYEVGEKEDILYIAREYVEADSLATYLEKHGPMPVAKVIALVKQIASALDYAHAKGVKHGDLSDNSVFVADDHVWLTDFGVVTAMEGTSMVKKGFAVGNPVYLSPERVKGEGTSRTADLYALGVLSYQMLTGQTPFSGEAPAVLHSQIYDQPLPPHEVNPKISPTVSEVVLRMLSKGLELRHNTGGEFVLALQAAAEGTAPIRRVSPPDNGRPTRPPQTRRPISRQFVFWMMILTPLIGLALAAGFWATNQWLSASRQFNNQQPVASDQSPGENAQQPDLTPVPRLGGQPPVPAEMTQLTATVIAARPTPLPAPTSTPTTTPTPLPLPVEPAVTSDSPFTNLILAQDISADFEPVGRTNVFKPTEHPIYLFFDYNAIQAGTSWRQTWKWDDVVLQEAQDVWPEEYGPVGTAWIYFSPANGFNPGPYTILLEVEGEVVATVNFVVQAGN